MGETRNTCKTGYEGVDWFHIPLVNMLLNLRVPENWGLVDQLSYC
jgi:hypothetical protein